MFSTPPEVRTFAALHDVLAPLGYTISQKARVLDCVQAAAANPQATTPVGPTLGDVLVPALREAAGPFGPTHPWLHKGDWSYAFRAHFDFVVRERLAGAHPTHPLFAVEFDSTQAHATAEAQQRDLAKNRLCAASGLPLVRVDDTFLHRRERLSLVAWLARLWAAYHSEMPRLLAERDAEVAAMTDEEWRAAGHYLLMERPDLDVDLIFRLNHPFPPARELAARLAAQHGFYWAEASWAEVRAAVPDPPRWKVGRYMPAMPSRHRGLVERWQCELTLVGPGGQTTHLQGLADVRLGYPLHEGQVEDSWDALLAGRLPYLPAGPWSTVSSTIGQALCIHNALIEVEHYLRQEQDNGHYSVI
jgi:hypothetical protein